MRFGSPCRDRRQNASLALADGAAYRPSCPAAFYREAITARNVATAQVKPIAM